MIPAFICLLIAFVTGLSYPVGLIALGLALLFAAPMASAFFYWFQTGQRSGSGTKPQQDSERDTDDEADKKTEHKEITKLVNAKKAPGKFFEVTLDVTAFNLVDTEEADDEADELEHLVDSLSAEIERTLEDSEHNHLSWADSNKIDGGIDALQGTPPVHHRNQPPLVLNNVELAAMVKVPDDTLSRTKGIRVRYSKVKPLHPRVQPPRIDDPINPPKGLVPIGRLTNSSDNSALAVENEGLDKHMLVVGGSGTGKSVHASHICNGIAKADYPLVVIDPHGSMVDDVLRALAAYRPERLKDIVLINLSDQNFPPALNPLAVRTMAEVPEAVNTALRLLENTQHFHGSNAPQATQYARVILEAMATVNVLIGDHIAAKYPDPVEAEGERRISLLTMMHIIDFLTDAHFRFPIVELAHDHGVPNVYAFFREATDEDEAETNGQFIKLKEPKRLEVIQPLIRVFAGLRNDKLFEACLAMDNRLDFAELINQNKIVLCRLGRFGGGANVGEIVAQMMLSQILGSMEKWGRLKDPMTGEYTGRGLRLVIDETPVVARGNEALLGFIVAEARKYGFGLIGYAQFLDQLDSKLQKELKANTQTKISLKLDIEQAKVMAANIGDGVTDKDIANLPLYTAYGRVLVDETTGEDSGAFAMNTLPPLPAAENPKLDPQMPQKLEQIVRQSRELIANLVELAQKRLGQLRETASSACYEVLSAETERRVEPAYSRDISAGVEDGAKDDGRFDWTVT